MLKTRLVNAVFILAIIFGLGVMYIFIFPLLYKLRPAQRLTNTPVIIQQVQELSELVTVKYVMEKVILFEDARWYGNSSVLMIVHGTALAGINLKEIKEGDIEIDGKKIIMKLPPARAPLNMTFIDDRHSQVVERTTGLLRAFDKDLEQTARQQAVGDLNRAARDAGIIADAEEKAKTQLSNLFRTMGFSQIEFRK